MAITKLNYYLGTIFVFMILSFLVFSVGVATDNSDRIDLDNKSKIYVQSYANYYIEETNMSRYSNVTIGSAASTELLTGNNETGEIIATDNFAIPKATQGSIAELPNFLKLSYTFPNLFLMGIGIDAGGFAWLINMIGVFLTFGLIVLLVKMTFNGGND